MLNRLATNALRDLNNLQSSTSSLNLYLKSKIRRLLFEGYKLIEIVKHNQVRYFSLAQAQDLLPLVYRVTETSAREVKYLMACVEALPDKKSGRAFEIQDQINSIINKWQNKLERLGAKPKGLWLADFDNGDGYFCWKFPETTILHKHGYQDGFTGRILISSNEESDENCPSSN